LGLEHEDKTYELESSTLVTHVLFDIIKRKTLDSLNSDISTMRQVSYRWIQVHPKTWFRG